MSINVIFGSNVAGGSNSGRTVEEMVQSAKKAIREKDSTRGYDAVSDVLEDVSLFKGLSLEDRLLAIENSSSNTELEEILGIPSDYYRNKYFALLKVIALSSDIK